MCLVKNNGSKRHECDMIDIEIDITYIFRLASSTYEV